MTLALVRPLPPLPPASMALPQPPVRLDPAVPRYVGAVLRWHASVLRAERAAGAGGSTWLRNVLLAPDGTHLWVGSGCRGTKGVGRAPDPAALEAFACPVDPDGQARYGRLARPARLTTDWVITDGQGDKVVEMRFGRRTVKLSMPARYGLALAGRGQLLKWLQKLAGGDAEPAIKGAEAKACPVLNAAAAAWYAAE